MSVHGSPVISFPAHELADLKARLAAGHTISSAHPQGKHKAGDILMSSLGMLRVLGVKPVAPHELTAHSGATKAHVAGERGDMLELKKLGEVTMNVSATTILQTKTAKAMKTAISPGTWAALGTLGALGIGAGVALPFALGGSEAGPSNYVDAPAQPPYGFNPDYNPGDSKYDTSAALFGPEAGEAARVRDQMTPPISQPQQAAFREMMTSPRPHFESPVQQPLPFGGAEAAHQFLTPPATQGQPTSGLELLESWRGHMGR